MPDFDLAAFLPYQLAVVAARVSKGFADRYRAEFGLTIPEWRVLAHLAQSAMRCRCARFTRGSIWTNPRSAAPQRGWKLPG